MRIDVLVGCTAPHSWERTTTVADFWDTLLRVEALWNSPCGLRFCEFLRRVSCSPWASWRAGSGACGGDIGSSRRPSAASRRRSSRSRRSCWIADSTGRRCCASGRAVATRSRRSSPTRPPAMSFRRVPARRRRPSPGFDGRQDGFLLASGTGNLGLRPTEGADFRHDVWVMAPVYERGRFIWAATSCRRSC